jgi:hypothetical protein
MANWYDEDWSNRKAITIDKDKVSGAANLSDFPVYFDLSTIPEESNFWTAVKADGGDIRITTSDGETEVPREIVVIDTTAKTGEIHFKGTLSHDADTVFYIYYGNSEASDYAVDHALGRNNVWSDYEAVYHLQDASGQTDAIDSTGSNDGEANNERVFQGTGKIEKGADFSGGNDRIDATFNYDVTTPITINVWANRLTSTQSFARVIDFHNHHISTDTTGATMRFRIRDGTYTTSAVSTNTWYMLTLTFDGTDAEAFVNGDSIGSVAVGTTTGTRDLVIGDSSTINTYWGGLIDEIGIWSRALTAGEITTRYNNQNSPSTFYGVGAEESAGPPPFNPPTVTTSDPENITRTNVFAQGSFELNDATSAKVYFKYKIKGTGDWKYTAKEDVTEDGTFSRTISPLLKGTNYELMAKVDYNSTAVQSISKEFTTEDLYLDLTLGTGTKGEKVLMEKWPVEQGTTAGTTRTDKIDVTLTPETSKVFKKYKTGM